MTVRQTLIPNRPRSRSPKSAAHSHVLTPASSGGPSPGGAQPGEACSKPAAGAEFSLTLNPLPGEGLDDMFDRLARALRDADTTLLKLMIFGSVSASPAAEAAMRRAFGRLDWPVTWVEGAAATDAPIAGLQAFAFSAGKVDRITLRGRVVGSVFASGAVRCCLLGGLVPQRCSAAPPAQFQELLERLQTALDQAGFSLADVMRTWFYLENLLDWYGEFNKVRTEAYARVRFRSGSLPASTGISGRNPAGAALVAGAWAMQPLDPTARVEEIASPLQCPAPAYGSSFSRAMQISSLRGRRLLISGTASIAPGGQTLWQGNIRQQIQQTMAVVEAILSSRGFAYSDLTRATAYFKHRADMPEFAAWCAARELSSLPVVNTHCGICRDDLLFELEADAWKPSPPF